MNTKIPVLKKKKIRQAIQYAINGKELMIMFIEEQVKKLKVSFHHGILHLLEAEDLSKIRQNTAKAKQLLKEEGYGPGGKN